MTETLQPFIAREITVSQPEPVVAFARTLATDHDCAAVLFYGSVLRTGDFDGVLDFYVLTKGPHGRGLRGLFERHLWPEVSFHEFSLGDRTLRAKVATMSVQTFAEACAGKRLDTTIWARFVQPCALVWVADADETQRVVGSLAAAAATAGQFAALHGPARGEPLSFWRALFRQTYQTELRFERPGRETQILQFDPARYIRLLPMAWREAGVSFSYDDGQLTPILFAGDRKRFAADWTHRRRWGKALNAARLIKAAFTFEGAARYAAWKIERHTGLEVPLTPWRERHPILATPGVLWRLWRLRRRQAEAN